MTDTKLTKPHMKLDGLFGHLSSSTGLYSKETFLSLYSCITRMIRDQRLEGLVLTRTLEDEAFEAMTLSLENLPNVGLYQFNQTDDLPESAGISPQTGFLLVLTNRLCAALYWSAETNDTFRMYEGGWTFHPGDTKTIASHLVGHLDRPDLEGLLETTPVDRRYDDKLNLLITALVHGLENRNRELTVALDQVNDLNHKVVQNERLVAIGQLSSVIAHEIRNPLGLIDLYAKLTEDQLGKLEVQNGPLLETLQKNLFLIRQATSGLETILSELTNYSKPLQLKLSPIHLHQLVQDVVTFYQPSYQEKDIQLLGPGEEKEDWILELDGDRIRQALINLLKNALEASPSGSQVTVRIASRKNDRHIYIKVSDQGCGVDPHIAKKLFTPYFSTKSQGTGLGLAHSRKILQAHGGSVELLSSTPEQGSTFAIVLPKTVITKGPTSC